MPRTDDRPRPGARPRGRGRPERPRKDEQPELTEQQKDAITAGVTKDGQAWEVTEDITWKGNTILKEGAVVAVLELDGGNRACIATHYTEQRQGDTVAYMPRSVALTDSQRGSLRKTDRPFHEGAS